jgi:exonuclease III
LRVCLWNIHGNAIAKLSTYPLLLNLFDNVDVVALTETHHLAGDTLPTIAGFRSFDIARPATKLGANPHGGLAVFVRETWADDTTVWKTASDASRMWLRLDNGSLPPLFLCIVYAAPKGSPYADSSLFADICQEVAEATSQGGVLLAGDFNARTGTEDDFFDCSDLADVVLLPQAIEDTPPNNLPQRQNCDIGKPSGWHREFLDLCRTAGLFILNGRTPGDMSGECTGLSNTGFSTVDYFLTTSDQLECVKHLEVICDDAYSSHNTKTRHSDHRPLILEMTQQRQVPQVQQKLVKHLPRFKYDPAKAAEFNKNVQHNLTMWASSDVLDTSDVDTTIHLLQKCITKSAEEVFGARVSSAKSVKHIHKPWFDAECRQLKSQFAKMPATHPGRQQQLKQMKQLFKRKKRAFDALKAKQLCGLAKADPAAFWKRYRKRAEGVKGISSEALREGFQRLLQPLAAPATAPAVAGAATQDQVVSFPPNDIECTQLNADITLGEVQQAFKKLKRYKAAGIDGIKPEFLLDAADTLYQPLLTVFNKILREGYSESLSIGIIHALYKGGDCTQFDNYRGITVGPVLAKVFAMILEARISQWAEANDLRAKGQAGFRKDYRTTDNLFILRTLTEQAKLQKKKLYTCFVDFKKAFDTVPRDLLWQVLERLGIRGRILECLRSMYRQDQACLHHPEEGLTPTFLCRIGVKQGCPLSPLLFGLFIDGLEKRLNAMQGDAPPMLGELAVRLLLYADDLALMSHTRAGLQRQLDVLHAFCCERQLAVNVRKTKVVIFGKAKANCQDFIYDGAVIERLDSFKYLGIELHATKGMQLAVEKLAMSGKKAVFALRRRCAELHICDPAMQCQLFDALVKPVLSYACEVWSDHTACQQLEVIHRAFLKSLLGVRTTTSSYVVLAEFGRFPLESFWWQQTMRFFTRISSEVDSDRMLRLAYDAQLHLLAARRQVAISNQTDVGSKKNLPACWLAQVDEGLSMHNLRIDTDQLPASAQLRKLTEKQYLAQHDTAAAESSRVRAYLGFNPSAEYGYKAYLSRIDNVQLRTSLARFRCANHKLEIELGRQVKPVKVPVQQRFCKLCNLGAVEDEDHFLLVCPAYQAIRGRFRGSLPITAITSLAELLSCQQQGILARFLVQCQTLRSELLHQS